MAVQQYWPFGMIAAAFSDDLGFVWNVAAASAGW